MNSPSQPFLGDIVGAQDVINGTTNSTSGVVAEGNTLRITLVQPEGDFLARLAMPFTCPLPLSVPVNPNGIDAPVPSAGPYYIAGWTRNREVLVKENPNYTGSRPHHFDEIHYRDRPAARDDQAPDRSGRDGLGRRSARGPRRAWHALRAMHARLVAKASLPLLPVADRPLPGDEPRPAAVWRQPDKRAGARPTRQRCAQAGRELRGRPNRDARAARRLRRRLSPTSTCPSRCRDSTTPTSIRPGPIWRRPASSRAATRTARRDRASCTAPTGHPRPRPARSCSRICARSGSSWRSSSSRGRRSSSSQADGANRST